MRIVSRAALLALPAGTLFQTYAPHCFGPLEVLEGVSGKDFVSEPVSSPTFEGVDSSGQWHDLLYAAEKDGRSMPLTYGDSAERDGLFGTELRYAVYEKQDVARLLAYLHEQLRRAY